MGDIAKDIQSTFASERTKALINIIYTANWLNSKQNSFFKPYGLSPQQYNVLRILRGAKAPLSMQQVKERMIERSPNATRMTDKLCEKELIERIACASDRRVVHIKITDKGLELLSDIDSNFKLNLLANLSTAEAKDLNALLDKIR